MLPCPTAQLPRSGVSLVSIIATLFRRSTPSLHSRSGRTYADADCIIATGASIGIRTAGVDETIATVCVLIESNRIGRALEDACHARVLVLPQCNRLLDGAIVIIHVPLVSRQHSIKSMFALYTSTRSRSAGELELTGRKSSIVKVLTNTEVETRADG